MDCGWQIFLVFVEQHALDIRQFLLHTPTCRSGIDIMKFGLLPQQRERVVLKFTLLSQQRERVVLQLLFTSSCGFLMVERSAWLSPSLGPQAMLLLFLFLLKVRVPYSEKRVNDRFSKIWQLHVGLGPIFGIPKYYCQVPWMEVDVKFSSFRRA